MYESYTITDVQRLLHEGGTVEEQLDLERGIQQLPTQMDREFIRLICDGYSVTKAVRLVAQTEWRGNSQRYSDGVIRKLVALLNGVEEDGTNSTQLSRPVRGEDDGGEDAT